MDRDVQRTCRNISAAYKELIRGYLEDYVDDTLDYLYMSSSLARLIIQEVENRKLTKKQ